MTIFTYRDDSERIIVVSIPCPGEGYKTHIFADGKYMVEIKGHCCWNADFCLNRHWSAIGEAKIRLRGEELTKNLVDRYFGRITPEDFEVIYEEEEND